MVCATVELPSVNVETLVKFHLAASSTMCFVVWGVVAFEELSKFVAVAGINRKEVCHISTTRQYLSWFFNFIWGWMIVCLRPFGSGLNCGAACSPEGYCIYDDVCEETQCNCTLETVSVFTHVIWSHSFLGMASSLLIFLTMPLFLGYQHIKVIGGWSLEEISLHWFLLEHCFLKNCSVSYPAEWKICGCLQACTQKSVSNVCLPSVSNVCLPREQY